MFPKLYSLGSGCSFAEEPGRDGQAVCSIRRVWKHLLKEGMSSLNGGGEMSWRRSRARQYSQMAQAGRETQWNVGVSRREKAQRSRESTMCARVHAQSLVLSDSFLTPWAVTRLPPLCMEYSRHEYLNGLCHFLFQGSFPTQTSNPPSLASPAMAGGFFTTVPPGKPEGTMFRAKCPEGPGKGILE